MIQDQIKATRLAKGLSQEELAARIHVVRQTVSKWETGLSVPDARTLIRIAQVLEVPVAALLGGEPVQSGEEEPPAVAQIAERLEQLNAEIAERNAAGRRWIRTGAVCIMAVGVILLGFLLLTGAERLFRQPSGGGIIGGADSATGILVFAEGSPLGIGIAGILCVLVIIAAGIILSRTK